MIAALTWPETAGWAFATGAVILFALLAANHPQA